MPARLSLFQEFKPSCVALNTALVACQNSQVPSKDILSRLESLLSLLRSQAQSGIDAKLADYIFFPVSGVFRYRQSLPVRAQELALQCLSVLFSTGWSTLSDADVILQLLVLLTYLADGGNQQQNGPITSVGLRQSGLACLTGLFAAVHVTFDLQKRLFDDANMPAVAHAVTVMLDGLKGGEDSDLQLHAAQSLQLFVASIATPELLRNFFPGIASSLVHVSKGEGSSRPSFKVLETCLQILRQLIEAVLSDTKQSIHRSSAQALRAHSSNDWLKTTSSQMSIVLGTVARLRNHARPEVRQELKMLCWTVVADCITTLADVLPVALDIIVSSLADEATTTDVTRLEGLLLAETSIAEAARDLMYEWVGMVSRMLSSSDDHAKIVVIRKIKIMRALLESAEINLELVEDLLFSNLVDGLSHVQLSPSGGEHLRTTSKPNPMAPSPFLLQEVQDITESGHSEVETLLLRVHREVKNLLEQVGDGKGGLRLARHSLHQAQLSQGHEKSVYFWLCTCMMRNRSSADHLGYEFLAIDMDEPMLESNTLQRDMYDMALGILHTSDEDQRAMTGDLRVLALDMVALQARYAREEFRAELVDALYPVVHLMGSPEALIQRHAILTLNSIAAGSGYADTQQMLVENVDYLVNAVGLKLSSHDISPQVPQVLIMMTKLCGSKLVPYLDDVVDSTFEALEHFHGYGRLVELLFSMLDAVVEAGAQASPVAIESSGGAYHRKPPISMWSMKDAIAEVRKARMKHAALLDKETEPQADHLPDLTPQQPWKRLRSSVTEEFDKLMDERADAGGRQPGDVPNDHESLETPKLSNQMPLTKTYTMVLRIAELTQHHLPSPSPSVRALLLSLLVKAIPYLARHEDSFLPLVNLLWPMLVARLADEEAFVVSGVLEAMSSFCEGAGDFMNTRIHGIWPTIQQIWHQTDVTGTPPNSNAHSAHVSPPHRSMRDAANGQIRVPLPEGSVDQLVIQPSSISGSHGTPGAFRADANVSTSSTTGGTRYVSATALAIRSALTRFLVAVLNHVHVSESIFREILRRMLHDQLARGPRDDVREAMARLNPDAVWLVLQKWSWSQGQQVPALKHAWRDMQPSAVHGKHFAMARSQ